MRLRISDYTIKVDTSIGITFDTCIDVSTLSKQGDTTLLKNAIRLVVDESKKYVMTSSMQKDLIEDIAVVNYPGSSDTSTGIYMRFNRAKFPNVTSSDAFTIEVDLGEKLNLTTQEIFEVNRKIGTFEDGSTVQSYLQQIITEYYEAKLLIVEALNDINIDASISDSWMTLAAYISNIQQVATPITDASIAEIFERIDQGELN